MFEEPHAPTPDIPTRPMTTPPPPWPTAPGGASPRPGPAGGPEPSHRRRVLVAAAALALAAGSFGAGLALRADGAGSGSSAAARFVVPGGNGGSGNGGSANGGPGSGQLPNDGFANGDGSSSGSGSGGSGADAQQVADAVDSAVVNIDTTVASGGEAAGTGMVLTSGGEVLTNFHVIDGATAIQVEVGVSGKTYRATVQGYDQSHDVALLQLRNASGLDTVKLGDSSGVGVGDGIVAVGNALGQGGTPEAVAGSVTALNQTVTAGDGAGSETLDGMIQIQAAIQSGDSGGPVVSSSNEVIGMTTAANTGSGGGYFGSGDGAATVGFAIPIDRAESIVSQIRSGARSDTIHLGAHGYLGVQATDGGTGSGTGSGALVAGVASGSGADRAGIQAGDVITAINGTRVAGSDDLSHLLGTFSAGDRVRVTWTDSSGATRRATVELTDLSS